MKWSYLTTFILGLVLSFGLTPLVRYWGLKRGWVDQPNERKLHKVPITDLGGVAIISAFFIAAILGIVYLSSSEHGNLFPIYGLFAGTFLIFVMGWVDDRKGLNATAKFSVQVLASVILWYCGGKIEYLTNPFGGQIQLGIFSLPFTVIWLVGVSNAVNLIDGLDGLAGGVSYIAGFTLMLIAILQGEPVVAILMAAMAGGILGFLRYNFPPASIFMGDTGALPLGFLLASSAVLTRYKATVALTLLIPIVALFIPIADTLFAILRRAMAGRPLFQADRGHLHHHLLRLGLTPRQTILWVYGFCLFFSILSLSFMFIPKQVSFLILILLTLGGLGGMLYLDYLENKKH